MYGQYSRAGYSYSSDDYAIWTGKKKIQISQRLTWFLYEYAIQASFEIRDVFRELKSKKVFRAFLVTILDVLVWVFPGGLFNGAEIIINISVYCSGFYAFEKFYVGQQKTYI